MGIVHIMSDKVDEHFLQQKLKKNYYISTEYGEYDIAYGYT
jgi:hypothetical protein